MIGQGCTFHLGYVSRRTRGLKDYFTDSCISVFLDIVTLPLMVVSVL